MHVINDIHVYMHVQVQHTMSLVSIVILCNQWSLYIILWLQWNPLFLGQFLISIPIKGDVLYSGIIFCTLFNVAGTMRIVSRLREIRMSGVLS